MRDSDMQKAIAKLHGEIDNSLQKGDRESLTRLINLLSGSWPVLFERDAGLKYTYKFLHIWHQEMAANEGTILAGVKSVEEVLLKYRRIRFALWRLENDFPEELCLEAIQCITDMQLSSVAFQYLLTLVVEDEAKVLARISEISSRYE